MNKLILPVLGLTALASVVFAADAEYTQYGTRGEMLLSRGYTSTTTQKLEDLELYDNRSDVYVNYVCGTIVSLSLVAKTADGQVLSTQSVACDTTPRQVSYTAPVYFDKLSVSQTTAVSGTAGVTSTIIETK